MSQRSRREKGCTAGSREERRGRGTEISASERQNPGRLRPPVCPETGQLPHRGQKSRNGPTGQRQDLNPGGAEEGEGKTSLLKASVLDAHSPRTCKA